MITTWAMTEKTFSQDGKGIPLLEGKSIEQYEVIPSEQIRIHVPESSTE